MKTSRPCSLILGLGRFGGGVAAARFLNRHGHRLRISDAAAASSLQDSIQALAEIETIDWRLGPPDPDHLDGIDQVVVNPAVPPHHALVELARARQIPITQEVNLFLEHFPGRVVLVTGTNGKSSTTMLLAAVLRRSGLSVLAGGNIGHSLLEDEAHWHGNSIAVLEVSSFQLERMDPHRHRVTGSVLTRITVDHLDRHGSLANYHRAKAVAAAAATEFVAQAADDAVASSFPATAKRIGYGGGSEVSASTPIATQLQLCNGWMVSELLPDPGVVAHSDAMQLLGAFQRENALGAAAAALALGAPRHTVGLGIVGATPLPFRLQRLGSWNGIDLFDNAVSTDVLSTLSAVETLGGTIHWVGGGKSKDGNYARVAQLLAPHLSSAHLFGAAAQPLGALLSSRLPTTIHPQVEAALDAAWQQAAVGDQVLFSPAFASFDQYPNFRARGLAFHRWAAATVGLTASATGVAIPQPLPTSSG